MSFLKFSKGEIVDGTYTTSDGFDEFGYPIRYDIASACGINYIPTKGLIFYAPCKIDINVEIGNQFTSIGNYTTQVVEDVPCLKFDTQYSQTVNISSYVYNRITLSAWYYSIDANKYGGIIAYGYLSQYLVLSLYESYGEFVIDFYKINLSTGYKFEKNKWYHLAVTLDNDTIKAYVNGKLVNTFTKDMYVYGDSIYLGGFLGRSPNGYITKCRIYNRSLTDKEIKQLAREL